MKSWKNMTLGLALVGVSSLSSVAMAATYNIDPTHTSVVASWNHFGFSNPTADFSGVTGTLVFDEKSPAKSSVSVTIPVKTVDTHVKALTDEFMGKDYFDVAAHPEATFVSDKVTKTGDKTYDVSGKMTIKGITKEALLKVTLNGQGEHPMKKVPAVGFDAVTTIKRSDYDMAKYVPYVSDEVTLRITTEATE
ncbi:polyisoprenoid-binding protein [Shewanella mangrovi]|uniref:Polyisoprenoid-binding protein n=1 Tax=Shewanella mangrovi TaxID=1515746 RepID=A0A094K0K8_9GAMM|nr:YceI family protein [Shewanella mangrovi]KFZ38206.1 polyisoprenoid-binding protein [Shewanella mangrovi]